MVAHRRWHLRVALAALALSGGSSAAVPPSQLLLGYFSGVGLESAGPIGLNALALCFFDAGALATGVDCNFTAPGTLEVGERFADALLAEEAALEKR